MDKRINIYADSMNPESGGIQNTSYEFFKELKKNYEIRGLSKELPNCYKDDFITEVKVVNRITSLMWLLRNSDKNTCNIVMSIWLGIPALISKKVKKSKYFVLTYGNDIYNFAQKNVGLKQSFWKIINRRILNEAEFVACCSRYTKSLLNGIVPDERCHVIHPPCANSNRADFNNVRWDEHTIFSVGRIEERKGFQFVIEAVSILAKDYPDIKYFIGGDGPYKKNLEDLIFKLRLEDKVFLLGRIDDETKYAYFESCEVFAMTSIEIPEQKSVEGFGIVYLEANQFGKYVIAGSTGGIADSVINGVTGSIIEKITPEEIALTINDIFYGREHYYNTDMIEQRIKWANDHTTTNIVKQYLDVMRKNDLV